MRESVPAARTSPLKRFSRWFKTRGPVLKVRVHVNEVTRRAVPSAAMPVIVDVRSRVGRRRPGRMEKARESIRFMLGDSLSEPELHRLSLDYLRRTSWRAEVRSRPSLITRQDVVGLEHLQEALAAGRGCLVSFMHHGDYIGAFGSIANRGQEISVVGDSNLWDPHGLLWQHLHLRAITSVPGVKALDVAMGSAGIRKELASGAAVAVAIDFPGHTPTHIFGRDLLLSSGGIRVAHGGDVPVVPIFSERIARGPVGGARVVVGQALRPADYATPEDMHAELSLQFEKSMLAWPEAVEEPLRMDHRHLVWVSTEYHSGA